MIAAAAGRRQLPALGPTITESHCEGDVGASAGRVQSGSGRAAPATFGADPRRFGCREPEHGRATCTCSWASIPSRFRRGTRTSRGNAAGAVLDRAEDIVKVASAGDKQPVGALSPYRTRHSAFRGRVPTGARTAVRTIRSPIQVTTASRASVNTASASRMKNRSASARSPRSISTFRACCVTQAPGRMLGHPARCTRRVPCSMKSST